MIEELLTTIYDPIKLKYPAINFNAEDKDYFEEDLFNKFDPNLKFTGITPVLSMERTEKTSDSPILSDVDFSTLNPFNNKTIRREQEVIPVDVDKKSTLKQKISKEYTEVKSKDVLKVGYLMNRLQSELNLSKNQAAGIIGNIFVESRFNPKAKGDGGLAIGLAQWHPERRLFLDIKKLSFEDLVSYLIKELKTEGTWNSKFGGLKALRKTATPEEAAALVDQGYERSSGRDRKLRESYAAAAAKLKLLRGGKL